MRVPRELKVGSRRGVPSRRARLVVEDYFGNVFRNAGKRLLRVRRLGVREAQRRQIGDAGDRDIFTAAPDHRMFVEEYLYAESLLDIRLPLPRVEVILMVSQHAVEAAGRGKPGERRDIGAPVAHHAVDKIAGYEDRVGRKRVDAFHELRRVIGAA